MKKKFYLKTFILIFVVVAFAVPIYGDLQEEKDKKAEMEQELKDTESYLSSLENLKNDSEAYIAAIDKRVGELASNIYSLEQQAAEKQSEIDAKEVEIQNKEAEIDKQYEDMAVRIQYMYENGNAQSATMILQSADMEELLNRANYITELTQYDRDMLNELEASKAELDIQKTELQSALNELNSVLNETKSEQQAQQTLMSNKKTELDAYYNKIYGANSQIQALEEDIAAQEELIKELEEIERKRKLQNLQLTYNGGQLSWPLPGYSFISSSFGYRVHPITGVSHLHSGIDIPAPLGTPIYAAYDGQVAWANYNWSAGNWIGIDHGNGLYTIYMHMSAFKVEEGTYVKKGDLIGLVGSTGSSTGPHLHFTVRLNGSYVEPLSYVSP